MIEVQIDNDVIRSGIEKAVAPLLGTDAISIIITAPSKDAIKIQHSGSQASSAREVLLSCPVKPSHLCASISNMLKKHTVPNFKEVFDLGDYVFEPAEFHLKSQQSDKTISLTEKERNILWCLCTQKQQILSREALLKKIWNYVPDIETHTLETHIYRLRQKIEPDPSHPQIIVTAEHGYRIATLVE